MQSLRCAGLALAVLGGVLPCRALNPSLSLLQYTCRTWARENGLPATGTRVLTQTRDGYIWLGTQTGLVRFDGVSFSRFTLPTGGSFRSEVVSCLAPSKQGGLWFGVANGPLGFCDGEGIVSAVPNVAWVHPSNNVIALLTADDGTLWVGTDQGLGLYRETEPQQSTFDPKLLSVRSITEDTQHRIWLVSTSEGVFVRDHGRTIPFPDPGLKQALPIAAVADPGGRVWIGSATGLRCYNAALQPERIPPFSDEVKALLVDRQGVLWIGTGNNGLACFRDGEFHFLRKNDGLADNTVTSLFEDREGDLWVGTRRGLSELSDVKFPIYSAGEGLIGGMCHGVAPSAKGGIWVGTSEGLSYFDGRHATNFTEANGLSSPYIKRAFEARNGDVYLLNGRRGIDILSGDRVVAAIACPNWPTALAEDAGGVIVSVGGELDRVSRAGLAPYRPGGHEVPAVTWIRNLFSGRDGALWVASVNGILRLKDGTVQRWSTGPGALDNDVYSLCEDEDGVIWAGTAAGVIRWKNGELRHVHERDGLPDELIYTVIPDGIGNLWADSSRGIFRVSLRDLNGFCDGKSPRIAATLFDGSNAVKTIDSAEVEYVACRSGDGRLWFPTPLGAAAIDPGHIPVSGAAPLVRIESIVANGTALPLHGPHRVDPGPGELEFRFAALTFVAPQAVRFRYRLEGQDKGWVETNARPNAHYTNLPPGPYTFRVTAANADGVWNPASATVAVELRPYPYQTGWFRLLGGALVVALGLGWSQRRKRRRQQEQQAQAENQARLESEVRRQTEELRHENSDRRRAEEALKVSEAFLQSLLETLPVQVVRSDLAGRITFANATYGRSHGITPAEAIGRTAFDHMSREDAERQQESNRQVVTTGSTYDAIETFTSRDGELTHNRVIKVPVFGTDAATVVGCQAMVLDVTEQKRAEERYADASRLLEMMLSNSPDAIYFKDRESRYVLVSHSMVRETLARLPQLRKIREEKQLSAEVPDELLLNGLTDFELYVPDDAHRSLEDEQQIMANGKPVVGKLEALHSIAGETRWLLTSKMPWRDAHQRIVGTFGIAKDITSLKEAEERLEQLNRKLRETSREAGMAEVATGVLHNVGNVLNSVNVSATLIADYVRRSKSANIAKLSLLVNQHTANLADFVAHDARGRMIPGYLASLAEAIEQERIVLGSELEQLRKNVDHIKEIVAMQQAYARTSGVTETVSVPDLIEDALRMNAGSLARHEVDTIRDYQSRPVITTDKHKVMQILINLVRNAKYACDESGRTDKSITVRATADDQHVRIAVSDNGVGIEPENLTRIFAHGFTTRKHGHGFGLHSGALAARELGGSLTVKSDGSGKGATFILELPYNSEKGFNESHRT